MDADMLTAFIAAIAIFGGLALLGALLRALINQGRRDMRDMRIERERYYDPPYMERMVVEYE